MADQDQIPQGFITWVVRLFLESKLSILLILFSLGLGAASIMLTPREEEPQIVVPMADVYIQAPGASAEEVEKLVATPLERLLWQVDGVEYVYSTSQRDMAVVTVRFFVGEDRERSLVKLHNKISMNADQAPPIVKGWVIKPVEIDDVPIVNLTLYSARYDDHALMRIGQEVLARLSEVEDISRASITGGRKREVRVELLPDRMSGLGVSMLEVGKALAGTDASVTAGSFSRANKEISVTGDGFVCCARDVEDLVAGVHGDRPVYVRDIARVTDGPEEAAAYSRFGFSSQYRRENGLEKAPADYPAVTLALAKKKGVNAVNVAEAIHAKLEDLKKDVIPPDVFVITTRDYGETAQSKVDELLASLLFAILTVVALLVFTLGWREALVVALAVPISFALALFVNLLFGYTINRVTLFALILSLGLVVDDPIINVDNIQRHIGLGRFKPKEATLYAVNEVLPPVIMSTLAIIVSFAPMFFISGMMGPYMSPMAANVPLTVIFSMVCALTLVPWFCYHMLKGGATAGAPKGDITPPWVAAGYAWTVRPFLNSSTLRVVLAVVVGGLLVFSASLALFGFVPLKMLPFDNKNEFQIVLDMPEGTPLEATDRAVRAFEGYLRGVPEVVNTVSYAGSPSPMDFNGMVRHYYLRQGGNMADIRVNLYDKVRRQEQSHAITLRLRPDLEAIAQRYGVNMKIVEAPPGPPVISTLAAEIYGAPHMQYADLIEGAAHVRSVMAQEPFVVDIDDTTETPRDRLDFVLDKEKAALHGVTAEMIAQTLRMAVAGANPATVHAPGERQHLPVRVVLPRAQRSGALGLSQIPIKAASGKMVALGELGAFRNVPVDQPIYHKNLKPVVYVFGEMAGRAPGEAVLSMQKTLKGAPPPPGVAVEWAGEGEWEITLSVFRDMGLAFLAAFAGIYVLLVIQMNSFFMPVLILTAIPLTFIGIMPGFWLFNLLFGTTVGPYNNPVFFTATSMIGMIALGGIVIRNSLVLIEFIQQAVGEGAALKDAILQSGAVRLRPIALTAATTALGAWPITLDPIFSGLAWALIFGLFASTAFTLLVVPVAYYALNKNKA